MSDKDTEILRRIRLHLYELHYKWHIEACFIDKKYFKALKINTAECEKCPTLSGDFEDYIEQISSSNKDINLFLYIDPYGFK